MSTLVMPLAQTGELREIFQTPIIGEWDFAIALGGNIFAILLGLGIILSLFMALICLIIAIIVSHNEEASAKWLRRARKFGYGFLTLTLVAVLGELVLDLWDGIVTTLVNNL